jgi:uncharacterized membrane protein
MYRLVVVGAALVIVVALVMGSIGAPELLVIVGLVVMLLSLYAAMKARRRREVR